VSPSETPLTRTVGLLLVLLAVGLLLAGGLLEVVVSLRLGSSMGTDPVSAWFSGVPSPAMLAIITTKIVMPITVRAAIARGVPSFFTV
jgi:hypothetical protein